MSSTSLKARFWLAQGIRDIWGKRSLTFHRGEPKVLVNKSEDHGFYIILDLGISKKVLTSNRFSNINHFKQACGRLNSAATPATATYDHFNSSVLYLEGKAHIEKKRSLTRILAELENDLNSFERELVDHFCKRSHRYESAARFAKSFIELTVGCLISRMTGISLHSVLRSFRVRNPFFFGYFNPRGVLHADAALKIMRKSRLSSETSIGDLERLEVAEMFLTMGLDPLIGAIIAKMELPTINGSATSVFHFNPTTFVSRTCTQEIEIEGVQFSPGDECYLSLLPCKKEVESSLGLPVGKSLTFAVGPHSCIGKRISLSILKIADEIIASCYPNGFPKKSVLIQNRSVFLAFKEDGS